MIVGQEDEQLQGDLRRVGFVARIRLLGAIQQLGHLSLGHVTILAKVAYAKIQLVDQFLNPPE